MTFVMNCVNYIVNDIHARCQGDEFGLHAYEQGAFAGTQNNIFMELGFYVRHRSKGMVDICDKLCKLHYKSCAIEIFVRSL